ncbi:hypothetical protein D1007_54490 [Hordeum vulgare]|nr:hypothetical protein D1007_54490 [Hordeum vulgare]
MAHVAARWVALVVLVSLLASASATASAAASAAGEPHCCVDHHVWGNALENKGCKREEEDDECDAWCQSACRGGECKRRNKLHYCHCYC